MPKSPQTFADAMKELEQLNTWFQEEEIDLDQGLKKLRRGSELIKQCQAQLKDVENEFIEIKQSFEDQAVDEQIFDQPED
jgi:exodeoxyribonuclease VII small subunit